MKNVYLKYLCLLLFASNGYSQGSDVIFWVDNSGSISATEYAQMSGSIQAIMANVLECNPANRITVVQYGSTGGVANAKIWIETPFTNTATAFARRAAVGGSDYAHESLGLIGNALDGTPNANIVSPTTVLNRTPGNSLVIYFFTDAVRDATAGSCLVNAASTGVGTNAAFQNYTSFKTVRNATFVVTMIVTGGGNAAQDLAAKNAGAAIASGGGSYMGTIESYPADPDGAGTVPRFLLYKTDFILTAAEIDNTTEDICSVAVDPCVADLVLVSPTHNVAALIQDNRQASNSITASNVINNTAVGVYHAKNTIVLKPGFHGVNGSRFRGYIQDCPSDFVGRIALEDKPNKITEKKILVLSPNPANDRTILTSDTVMVQIEVKSLTGNVFFSKAIKDKSYELNISDYPKGFYLVTVTTETGEVGVKKLIKN